MNTEKYKFRTELHSHTNPASGCSQIPPEDVVKIYAGLGYDSIVISNHFYPGMRFVDDKDKCINAYLDDFNIAAEAGKKYGINVIFGCEMRFSENVNDYLLFGIEPHFCDFAYDTLYMGIEEFSNQFRNDKRVLLQAHPFRDGMTDVAPEYLDGIEVFNMHPGHNSRVAFAAKYAKEHDFIISAGTDFHHHGHEGMVALLSETEIKDSYDLAKVLKSRNYLFEIGGCIILPYGA